MLQAEYCRRRRVELTIESHPSQIASVRRALEAFAQTCLMDEDACNEIGLCVNEALANVIRHAYQGEAGKPIVVVVECLGHGMQITIRDWGNGHTPQMPEAPRDPMHVGGVGMYCLNQLMDQVRFDAQPDGMVLTMMRRCDRPGRKRKAE